MKIQIIIIALLFPALLNAQQDQSAMKVLSDFSKKASGAPSVSMDFKMITNDTRENSVDTIEGSITISGDRYKLIMPNNIVWSDGKTNWNYLEDAREVTVTDTDPHDKSFLSKPSLLFGMYKEGYKVRMLEDAAKYWIIDLYPEKLDNSLVRIRLKIGKSLYDLKSAEYKTKEGILITLVPERYDLTIRPVASFFTFDSARYKNAEINDMR